MKSDDSDAETPKRRSGTRPRKRKFHGNKYTKKIGEKKLTAEETSEAVGRTTPTLVSLSLQPSTAPLVDPCIPSTSTAVASPISASTRKLRSSLNPIVQNEKKTWNGFRIIDIDLFLKSIQKNCVCRTCCGEVIVEETFQCGFSSKFGVRCKNCGCTDTFRNSNMISKHVAEVNRRTVYAFKSLGLGYSSYKEFCGLMDFPKPVAHTTFDRAIDAINTASTKVAEESMEQAAKEEVTQTGNKYVTVSGDGSWQKRGFSSLFGIVSLIGLLTGKVVDFLVLSLVCKICDAYSGAKVGSEFEEWHENHAPQCTKNHEGSSGKMEVDGMVQLFKRSEEKNGLIYENYIGDGDSKTFKAVIESDPYENITVKKKECIAHVQKRMGTRLRNLKKELSGKKLSDGKSISGKGRLTDKCIDQISKYYGMAIRSSQTVAEMKTKVWAIFYHMTSTDLKPTHQFCPTGSDSWCKYQRAKVAQKLHLFTHKDGVPLACMMACKKVFDDLTHSDLLERCIGGFTQNPNESLNSLIWLGCPKTNYFGKKSVDIAAAEAVIQFNDGCRGKIKILREMGIQPGNSCINWAIAEDKARMSQAQIRAKEVTKEARIARLRKRKAEQESRRDDSYIPGGH